ncbi:MAG: hypothetical protein C5B54_00835 [Acidobacteria bacterium]|nr:MAG: hypothetical protein C5B54_00835 [Acidobacteriota bacterium]
MNAIMKMKKCKWLSLFIFAIFISSAPLFATTRYIAITGTDNGTCVSASTPCKTFVYSIGQASDGDTIRAAAGTYAEHDIGIAKNLTLIGSGIGNTYINSSFVGRVLDVVSTVTISDMTINRGEFAGFGAGIFNAGSLTLIRVRVDRNLATGANGYGAGICNTRTLNLNSSYVSGNVADASGGGIYNVGPAAIATLTDSTVSGNMAQYGAGILNYSEATMNLTNTRISRNDASVTGGGMDNNSATAVFNNVTFSANSADLNGGGMKNDVNANASLTNVTFTGNTAKTFGGGLYNVSGATLQEQI